MLLLALGRLSIVALLAIPLALGGCKRTRTFGTKPPPSASVASVERTPTIALSIAQQGVHVKIDGQNIAPGCSGPGPGVAVASIDADHQDFATLRQCLTTLKEKTPGLAAQTSIEIAADPKIAYATVIGAMDAARKTNEGKDLFPDVTFGVVKPTK
jgi:hypothetical protein